jgi:hypothetical protein
MPLPLCLSTSCSFWHGQRRLVGLFLPHWHRGPGFWDNASLGRGILAQQGYQQGYPTLAKYPDPAAGGSPSASAGTLGTTRSRPARGWPESSRPRRRHHVATATASHRRAARAGSRLCVRCHSHPARLVILTPGAIRASRPSQATSLASGGQFVRINHGSLSPASPRANRVRSRCRPAAARLCPRVPGWGTNVFKG